MIEVIILTSSEKGLASVQLVELVKSKMIKVKAVVLSQGFVSNKKKYYKRKINKTTKIGLLGALNGIRMRKWYSDDVSKFLKIEPIEDLCKMHNIPLYITPNINCSQTVEFFSSNKADIGLSLGNGYIGKRVFSVPKFGMINTHHEELPAYQNAHSIIWQIYNNSSITGYTIHKIDKHIDTGEIIFKETIPIVLKENLRETVSFNCAELWRKSSKGLVNVLENFETFFENALPQEQGNSYTTPSWGQYIRILKNFRKMKVANTTNKG